MEYSKVNKYRKKPLIISAIQWTGYNKRAVIDFCEGDATLYETDSGEKELYILTLEDGGAKGVKHIASVDDFIIKSVKGELYPCKPDIFFATYEKTVGDV